MADLSRQNLKERFPWTLSLKSYLRDHFFEGKAVFPAVEAMITLARAIKSRYSQSTFPHMVNAQFPRPLTIDPDVDQRDVQIETERSNDKIHASLLTSVQIRNSSMSRMLSHAKVTFIQDACLPDEGMSFRTARKLEGECIHVPAPSIYRELIPFGPAYQNIDGDLSVSTEGALAELSGGSGEADDSLLGSPFVLDAAMHAACVWGQRFTDIVPFPVGIDERMIYAPTKKGGSYLARVSPVDINNRLLIFDVRIFDQDGIICEKISGLRMQDISGGGMRPPEWIKEGAWKKS